MAMRLCHCPLCHILTVKLYLFQEQENEQIRKIGWFGVVSVNHG